MALKLINGAEFIHIPKTGGSWVSSKLELNHLVSNKFGHMHANYEFSLFHEQIRNKSGREHLSKAFQIVTKRFQNSSQAHVESNPIRFCFVRNPLSWYESWWTYAKGRDWREFGKDNTSNKWHPNSGLNGLGSDDFNEFIWNVIKKRPGYVSELLYSYTKPGISFIGRTEYLRDDLKHILTNLNLSYDESDLMRSPKVNVSKVSKSEIEWDPKLKEMTTKLELAALIHFGYLNEKEQIKLGLAKFIPPNNALIMH